MTSILRTYYTARQIRALDVSYNIMLQGRWILAEMTLGIIISCSPVMPKFFRHMSFFSIPKKSWKFMFGSRSRSNGDDREQSAPPERGLNEGRSHRNLAGARIDWHGCHTRQRDEYVILGTLGKIDADVFNGSMTSNQFSTLSEGPATKRQDVEAGHNPTWDRY